MHSTNKSHLDNSFIAYHSNLGFELRTKDDCVQASLNCSMHALCYASINTSNINTTRMCICPKGFTGDGESCKDINECAANELLCSPTTHECVNTNGSYRCDCKNGNQSCEVICAETCKNDGVCRWTNGAAECSCTHNFHGEFCQFYNNKIPTFGGLPISIMFMLIAVLLVLIGITVGLCYKLRKRPRNHLGLPDKRKNRKKSNGNTISNNRRSLQKPPIFRSDPAINNRLSDII
ncbi:Pro-epidermal growth factor [Trichoplax sp. H2]|nr:Pro-epidermal growth factor [Trichoplax sp. H2]|eukprot:RDD40574.1 Pro-epidermal growth factor [Trichoplax sp. H2]